MDQGLNDCPRKICEHDVQELDEFNRNVFRSPYLQVFLTSQVVYRISSINSISQPGWPMVLSVMNSGLEREVDSNNGLKILAHFEQYYPDMNLIPRFTQGPSYIYPRGARFLNHQPQDTQIFGQNAFMFRRRDLKPDFCLRLFLRGSTFHCINCLYMYIHS